MSPKTIIFAAMGFVALLFTATIGYYLFIEVDKVHQQNVSELADFGSKVVPLSSREGSDGVTLGFTNGDIQLPPSLQQRKLSTTEKVILSLSRDKEALRAEILELTQKADTQQEGLEDLRAYKAENERFAPEQLTDERQRAREMLQQYFDKSSDVTDFNTFQLHAITLATANLYTNVVRQHQLILNDSIKDKVIKLLPRYGRCLGEGLPFTTNSSTEEQLIIKALSNDDHSLLQDDLRKDYDSIHTPCLKQLNKSINQLLINQDNNPALPIAPPTSAATQNETQPSGPVIDPAISATEQLILTLNYEKERALIKIEQLNKRLEEQLKEQAELQQYHDQTERFAPLPTHEERERAYKVLSQYFDSTQDADRFNSFEKQAMSLSAANRYAALTKQHRLVLTESTKDEIIYNHLPNFGFCIGDGLKFVIDNALQQRQVVNALREQDPEYMDRKLQQQISTITEPCNERLDQQLSPYF